MVISGETIKQGVKSGIIGIEPFTEEQVELAHVNLHLGSIGSLEDGNFILKAKEFTVAYTRERIRLPRTLCGSIEGRSKLAQSGLSVEQSSTFIEPGSEGRMVLELFNASSEPVTLEIGQKIAKMVIMKITDELS